MRYITSARLKQLQTAIGFLNEYTSNDVIVGESLEKINKEKTEALNELAEVNKRRIELIGKLLT